MVHYVVNHQKNQNHWECFKCEQFFVSRDSFVTHVRQSNCFNDDENVRKFKCETCHLKFKRSYHLKIHRERIHEFKLKKNDFINKNLLAAKSKNDDSKSSQVSESISSKISSNSIASYKNTSKSFTKDNDDNSNGSEINLPLLNDINEKDGDEDDDYIKFANHRKKIRKQIFD